mgnify:CR=1 FL=1
MLAHRTRKRDCTPVAYHKPCDCECRKDIPQNCSGWRKGVTIKGHTGKITRALWGPVNRSIFSGSDDTTIRIWDWELFKEERQLLGHGWDVKSADWHPFYSLVATGSMDNTAKLWDFKKGELLHTFEGHSSTVWSVAVHPSGNFIATGSEDKTWKLWR